MIWRVALWTILGAAVIALAMWFTPARAQAVTACTTLESLLSPERADHRPTQVVDGWLGGLLAEKHARWTGLHPEHPVTTMLLQLLPGGAVAVWAQQGQYACSPAKLDPSEWRGVVIDLWGQGA